MNDRTENCIREASGSEGSVHGSMRILQIAHALPPTLGGVETYLGDLLPMLRSAGHQVAALSGGSPQAGDRQRGFHRDRSLDHHSLLAQDWEARPAADGFDSTLASVVESFQPDLVHAHNLHHFDTCFADALAGVQASGVPVIIGIHDRVGECMEPAVLARPWDAVVYASAHLRVLFPSECPGYTLHLGVDTERFRPDATPHPELTRLDYPLVVHPARLLRWKGPLVCLQAFEILREAYPTSSLVLPDVAQIVGVQSEIRAFRGELQDAVEAMRLRDCVHFRAFSFIEMPNVYAAATVIWYPTIAEEPFGLVPLEAMAAGTPIVASRSGGMVETIEHGKSGFLVEKGDASGLADATILLLRDAGTRCRIIERGLTRAEEFSMGRHVGRLIDLYRSVLAKDVQ